MRDREVPTEHLASEYLKTLFKLIIIVLDALTKEAILMQRRKTSCKSLSSHKSLYLALKPCRDNIIHATSTCHPADIVQQIAFVSQRYIPRVNRWV